MPADYKASLSVGPAGTISGNAGVNRFNGRFRGSGKRDSITTTRMSGPTEARYLKALEAAVKFEMTGGNLRVTCSGKDKSLVFTRSQKP